MRPTPRNYAIWPSIVLADHETEMTIVPNERAFLFFEDVEYRISIIPVNSDEIEYQDAKTRRVVLTAVAHGGVLHFSYAFCGEQEYTLILEQGEKLVQEFSVYSLYADLYALNPLKGDFHSHSYRSDGRRDPAALAGHFREQGYDFFALTDHNRYYPGGEIDEAYNGVNTGFTRVFGEEVHTPGSMVHIVHVGGKRSVTEQYINDEEGFERCITEEYEPRVPDCVPAHLRRRYAKANWACDRIHEAGGLAVFAHPFWRPGGSRIYNVYDEFAFLLLKSGMFDVYELVGGMRQDGVNRSVAMWADLRAEGLKISVVGSSDVHGLERSADFPDHFTICFASGNDNDAIIDAVRAGNSVACEGEGYEYDRKYRCYGSMRLVGYSQFLLRHFFPQMQRIMEGEGVMMRAFCMGDADAALVEAQAAQVEKFRARFFGKMAPVLPNARILEFEEKWRERHLQSPITKGSHLHSDVVSRQI